MSKLFSCFACTKKKKNQNINEISEDKLPKKKKKKVKGQQSKGKKVNVVQERVPLKNKTLNHEKNLERELIAEPQPAELQPEDKPSTQTLPDEPSTSDHLFAPPLHPGLPETPSDVRVDPTLPNEQQNVSNRRGPEIKVPARQSKQSSTSSEGGASNDDSCMTDSDLNISEAVFITDEGPKVGSLGRNLSRGGLHSMRATLENERFLERELLDRLSSSSKMNTSSNLRLSFDARNFAKEEIKL